MQSILAFISTYQLLDQSTQIIKLSLTLIRNQEITVDHALDTANEFEVFFSDMSMFAFTEHAFN